MLLLLRHTTSLPPAGAPHALGCSSQNLAISSSSSSSGGSLAENWQLLNAAYGVLEFLAQDPAAAGQQPEQVAGGECWQGAWQVVGLSCGHQHAHCSMM